MSDRFNKSNWRERAMQMIYGDPESSTLDDSQYSKEVRKDRKNVLIRGFDPDSFDYDYLSL